jgi:hypothetical protein
MAQITKGRRLVMNENWTGEPGTRLEHREAQVAKEDGEIVLGQKEYEEVLFGYGYGYGYGYV